MLQTIVIEVVQYEEIKLFQAEGIMFDKLEAFSDFAGGSLAIMRGEEVIRKTKQIALYGTHGRCHQFIWDGGSNPAVWSRRYQVGDKLTLEFDTLEKFDLVLRIKELYQIGAAHHDKLTVGRGYSPGEYRRMIREGMEETADEFNTKTVFITSP